MPAKADSYAAEGTLAAFWEPRLSGLPAAAVRAAAQHVTALVLRPELAMTRRVARCLRWLDGHGYVVVSAAPVRVDWVCEVLWRFQWNAVNPGTLHLVRLLYRSAPCLLLVLRHGSCRGVPAAVRLSGSKGAAEPGERSGASLRDALGAPSKILAMVHAPDEPADVLRDLALLARGNPHLAQSLTAALTGTVPPAGDPAQAALAWQDSAQPRALDPLPILAALAGRLAAADGDGARLPPLLADMRAGRKVEWLGLLAALGEAGLRLDPWQEIVLGGMCAQTRWHGPAKLIGAPDYARWAERAARRDPCCQPVG
jgi:hypothetical protein